MEFKKLMIEYCEKRIEESGITNGYYGKVKESVSQSPTIRLKSYPQFSF